MSDSPLALEAHGANTLLTRLYVFGAAAGIAAVGGVIIAGVTQSAGGTPTGPFGYFNSVVILAVLAICGSQPILSPVIAAFLFEVVKVYNPFNGAWFGKYEGVFFGAGALAVAVVPGMHLSFAGRRTAAREGRSPVTSRARTPLVPAVRVSNQGTQA
jgi:ABC-type branched-subunit amino acid transport system permease subunit